ncbi:hypothetical protein FN846DRAFT_892477 [Sphaerosporella brunnea]|uniref:Uncharacterized protein n=1 Tax=Sphaerosporella brunnea TaxID=1250544 RepID=A0A5J5EQC6_9PEZI|nr:hypothetical protein FN846DRAFT_892477 [Sphaerosporella brunnea]
MLQRFQLRNCRWLIERHTADVRKVIARIEQQLKRAEPHVLAPSAAPVAVRNPKNGPLGDLQASASSAELPQNPSPQHPNMASDYDAQGPVPETRDRANQEDPASMDGFMACRGSLLLAVPEACSSTHDPASSVCTDRADGHMVQAVINLVVGDGRPQSMPVSPRPNSEQNKRSAPEEDALYNPTFSIPLFLHLRAAYFATKISRATTSVCRYSIDIRTAEMYCSDIVGTEFEPVTIEDTFSPPVSIDVNMCVSAVSPDAAMRMTRHTGTLDGTTADTASACIVNDECKAASSIVTADMNTTRMLYQNWIKHVKPHTPRRERSM